MTAETNIEWCDSTFNPWIGCTKISPACDHCYAENMMDTRLGKARWGAGQQRVRTSAANWRQPLRWNRKAFAQCPSCGWRGEVRDIEPSFGRIGLGIECPSCDVIGIEHARRRVFCASLADVFDNEVPRAWRSDLFDLIRSTPHLDWLLLTKRIGNVLAMIDEAGGWSGATGAGIRNPLPNVWIGATICNQAEAERDIPKLLATPARIRFLSIEPMLGDVDITPHLWGAAKPCAKCPRDIDCECGWYVRSDLVTEPTINWVIAGGESGPLARPSHPDWFRDLRDDCAAAGVPFLFKQWGEWANADDYPSEIQEHYDAQGLTEGCSIKVGKKAAGRLLDGVEHNGYPAAPAAA